MTNFEKFVGATTAFVAGAIATLIIVGPESCAAILGLQ